MTDKKKTLIEAAVAKLTRHLPKKLEEAHSDDQLRAKLPKHYHGEMKSNDKEEAESRSSDKYRKLVHNSIIKYGKNSDHAREYQRDVDYADKMADKWAHRAERHGQAIDTIKAMMKKRGISESDSTKWKVKVHANKDGKGMFGHVYVDASNKEDAKNKAQEKAKGTVYPYVGHAVKHEKLSESDDTLLHAKIAALKTLFSEENLTDEQARYILESDDDEGSHMNWDGDWSVLDHEGTQHSQHETKSSALSALRKSAHPRDVEDWRVAKMGYRGRISHMLDHKGNKHVWSDDEGTFVPEKKQ